VATIELAGSESLTDIRGEQKLLSCILKSPESILKLPDGFSSDALTSPLGRSIFLVIENIFNKGASPDAISISEALSSDMQTQLEQHGGWGFLETLKELPIDPGNIEYIAKDLIDLSTRRRIEQTGTKISGMANDPEPIPKIIENIEVAINDIEGRADIDVISIGSKALDFIIDRMAHPTAVPGLETGFPELDKSIQGFQFGSLHVVGARKKTGKSQALLNFAKHIAVNNNVPILWISNEHSWETDFMRLLSLVSEVNVVNINNGTFSEYPVHVDRIDKAVEKISAAPFYFCSLPNFTLGTIKRITRKYARVYGVKALFFDLLKMPETEASAKEWQELGVLAYGLKSLALTENIAVISAVQINRQGAENFKSDGDYDSDYFAGSDRIAHALDVAMVLRPPTKKEADDSETFRVLRVSDARNVASNYKALLEWNPHIMQLKELKRI
jgi:replicative DNA helicase